MSKCETWSPLSGHVGLTEFRKRWETFRQARQALRHARVTLDEEIEAESAEVDGDNFYGIVFAKVRKLPILRNNTEVQESHGRCSSHWERGEEIP